MVSSLNGKVPVATVPPRLALISVIGRLSEPVDCSVPDGSHLKMASFVLSRAAPDSFSTLHVTASLVFATMWMLPPVTVGSAPVQLASASPLCLVIPTFCTVGVSVSPGDSLIEPLISHVIGSALADQ